MCLPSSIGLPPKLGHAGQVWLLHVLVLLQESPLQQTTWRTCWMNLQMTGWRMRLNWTQAKARMTFCWSFLRWLTAKLDLKEYSFMELCQDICPLKHFTYWSDAFLCLKQKKTYIFKYLSNVFFFLVNVSLPFISLVFDYLNAVHIQ